jgi:hypothetical protein
LCVILHRAGWGETPWTRLEEKTIGDRYMQEGASILVLVRLDEGIPPTWFPRTDFWVNYVAEGPARTAEYIVARLQNGQSDLALRRTSRTLDRRPVPIARYETPSPAVTEQYIPLSPVICDACTRRIHYRPLLRIRLLAHDGLPATEEILCPLCARERGQLLTPPPGMDESVLYAAKEPSFRYHVGRILRQPLIPALNEDQALRDRGVVHVGAALTAESVAFLVWMTEGGPLEVRCPLHQFKTAGGPSDMDFIAYARDLIAAALASSGH